MICGIETDDLNALLAVFGKRRGAELVPISDALHSGTVQIGFWQPVVD